jgi:DNA-directed RNA polymerase subunit RPC12/RpoP
MDLIFKCPKCSQELEVDASGAGEEIDCPSCGERIRIPASEPSAANDTSNSRLPATDSPGAPSMNTISSSAAAKVEMHLKVPVHSGRTGESLINKPLVPLVVAAKQSDRKIRVKSIRRTECVEVGHDNFDKVVTDFLSEVGEANIMNILPLGYTTLDISSQKILTDYGVLVVYRG